MDKAVLRNFAIESRKDLMEKIDRKIKLFYIDEEFKKENRGDVIVLSNDKHSLTLTKNEDSNRDKLIKRIAELGYDQVVEEAAYTWFNRIIAIRYMELHDYLPLSNDNQSVGVRVLSSVENSSVPDILKFSNLNNSALDINFNKGEYINLNTDNEKFKYLLILICKKLGDVIPKVFDGVTDYIELLIPDNLLSENGFVTKLINNVSEDNFDKVEVIGWLYQYYISEKKDFVFEQLRKNVKIDKDTIAAATQIFTPDWIVKYMVQNSLSNYCSDDLKKKLNFIIDTNKNNYVKEDISNIKFIDPCCGSGHILVYAFEIFYNLYLDLGYNQNDICNLIIENNLYGIDIDERASQLSILSVLLKAREYDKRIFNKTGVRKIHIYCMESSENISDYYGYFSSEKLNEDIHKLLLEFKYAKEIGTLLKIDNYDYSLLKQAIIDDNTIFGIELRNKVLPIIELSEILNKKYDVVVTNPPYIGSKGLSDILREYISVNYPIGKYDTYSSFILKCIEMCKENGKIGMMTPNTWMFISSYKSLRQEILKYNIDSLLHLSNKAFNDAAVIITSFIINKNIDDKTDYVFIDLQSFEETEIKEKFNELQSNQKVIVDREKFLNIPNNTFTYWLSDNFVKNLSCGKLIGDEIISDGQNKTGDNDKYLRFIWEIDRNKISPNKKWNIHAKGGEYRKWYGNLDTVIDWSEEARAFYKKDKVARITPEYLWFKKGITWTLLSGNNNSFRVLPKDCTFNCVGPSVFLKDESKYNIILGLLNSIVAKKYINGFNPTLSLTIGDISNVPLLYNPSQTDLINNLVNENINISKEEWDSYEVSWDFKQHPLLKYKNGNNSLIKDAFENWKSICEKNFYAVKRNEEELNKIFINSYNLNDEIYANIEDSEITIRKANLEREIKSLISYAVGCMFGRYSLDNDGVVFAGGKYDKSKYNIFMPDDDNIIPISDSENIYYNDDIVAKFRNFIIKAFGSDNVNNNIDFIANILGKKGTETSEDTIRRYFVNDFYNDHLKIYQKRPIYWMFDSGKKNGFKCLVYLHRYDEQIVSKIRTKYLHNSISIYQRSLDEINYKINNDELNTSTKRELQNKQNTLSNKIIECNQYEEMVGNVANKMIKLDLDDGVTINYSKFVDDNGKSILAKIK